MTVPTAGRPDADVDITLDLVGSLLGAQHPDLADLPRTVAATGWDNVMVRLGDELVVRLPRRVGSVGGLQNEQRWLPFLAPLLTVPVPVPVRTGVAGSGYPYPWSIVPWLPGGPSSTRPLSPAGLEDLAHFLRRLHADAPAGAPHNPFRGVPLAERDAAFRDRCDRAAERGTDVSTAEAVWATGLAAPSADDPVWLHGDLHHENILVGPDGRLAAVIDWNDVCAGDPASDLAAAWLVAEDADAFFAAYGPAPAGLRERAAAWAAYLAVMFLDADAPGESGHARMAAATLGRLAR